MNQDVTFSYNYSAKENKEVQEIRKRYLPREESKFEELKRLDYLVQTSGIKESLCVGISGALIFGLGMCFTMQVIGSGNFLMAFGILLGIGGMIGMIAAYPIHRKMFRHTKAKYTEKILELTAELIGEKN